MITLEATIICDTCKQVVASGEPSPSSVFGFGYSAAIEEGIQKAKALGAQIGISKVTCLDCLMKSTTTTPTVWVIEESK